MSFAPVISPYQPINGLTGLGLNNGGLYIGEDGQDPQTHPQACYWDAAGAIPAPQPIPIQGGYPMYLGSPARLYTGATYSIRVRDASGVQVFYEAHAVPGSDTANIVFGTRALAAAASIPVGITAIVLLGYATVGDSPVATYAEVADVGTLQAWQFRSNVNSRRWQLVADQIDPRQLGAKGDLTTDDAAVLNSTTLAAEALGAAVFIPAVTGFLVGSPVLTAGYITGAGRRSLLKAKATLGDNPVLINRNSNPATTAARDTGIELTNFRIDGNRANNVGAVNNAHCVMLIGVDGAHVALWLENAGDDGIYMGAPSAAPAVCCRDILDESRIKGCARNGVSITSAERVALKEPRIDTCVLHAVDLEPNVVGNICRNIDIRPEFIDGCGSTAFTAAVAVDGTLFQIDNVRIDVASITNQVGQFVSYRGVTGLKISGGIWKTCTVNFIEEFAAGFATSTDVVIDNLILDGGLAVSVLASDRVTLGPGLTIKNNTQIGSGAVILHSTTHAKLSCSIIGAALLGVYLNGSADNFLVDGAKITGSAGDAIRVESSSSGRIVNSILTGNGGRGIAETGTSDNNTYRGNTVTGNTSGGVSLSGVASTQSDNLGQAPPAVTGAKAGNVALANLLTVAAAERLVTDSST